VALTVGAGARWDSALQAQCSCSTSGSRSVCNVSGRRVAGYIYGEDGGRAAPGRTALGILLRLREVQCALRRTRYQAWDERHHESDKLRSAGAATVASAKRINEQYKVSERIGRDAPRYEEVESGRTQGNKRAALRRITMNATTVLELSHLNCACICAHGRPISTVLHWLIADRVIIPMQPCCSCSMVLLKPPRM
jgi:hypothetical protein